MKNYLALLLSVFTISSAKSALPSTWTAFFYSVPEEKNVTQLKFQNGIPVMPDNTPLKGRKISSRSNRFDFDKMTTENHVILVSKFKSDREYNTYIGVGCLAFAIELNGKNIYEFRRKGLGNDYDPVSAQDHIIPAKIKKGENTIVIYSCRTNWLLDYCYGANRKINWNFTISELPDYQPVKAELAHLELLLRPAENSMTVAFITKKAVQAGVDYRVAGTQKWTRQWNIDGEIALRDTDRNHIICMDELKPDTLYEYRLVLLQPPVGGEKRSLWGERVHKEIYTPVKTFKTLGKKNFNFFALADTQLSISETLRTVADREKYMQKMRELPEFKQADFIAHIGDLTSYFHNIEKDLIADFFDSFTSQKDAKPWVYVRGNHELDGIEASSWHKYFVPEGQKPYYWFKNGDVLFIVLACGDTTKGNLNAHIGPILDTAYMVKKQRAWLEKLVQSDVYKNAKFRIVLSHISPQVNEGPMSQDVRAIAEPLLNESIHLWIGAHCHRYWRMFRGSNELFSREKAPANFYQKTAPFNWITLDGPKGNQNPPDLSYVHVNVENNTLTAKVIDPDGSIVDHFTIDKDGNATEIKRAATLKSTKL